MRGATGAPKCGSSLAPKAPLVTQKGEAGEIKAKGATHPPSAHRQVSGLQRYGMESGEDEEYDDLGSGSFDEEGMENAISAFRQVAKPAKHLCLLISAKLTRVCRLRACKDKPRARRWSLTGRRCGGWGTTRCWTSLRQHSMGGRTRACNACNSASRAPHTVPSK
eukprot:2294779-Rhodomonas_salina.1